jgi:hypothetical protein
MSRTRLAAAPAPAASRSKGLPVLVMQLSDTLPSTQADHIDEGNGRTTMVLYMARSPG